MSEADNNMMTENLIMELVRAVNQRVSSMRMIDDPEKFIAFLDGILYGSLPPELSFNRRKGVMEMLLRLGFDPGRRLDRLCTSLWKMQNALIGGESIIVKANLMAPLLQHCLYYEKKTAEMIQERLELLEIIYLLDELSFKVEEKIDVEGGVSVPTCRNEMSFLREVYSSTYPTWKANKNKSRMTCIEECGVLDICRLEKAGLVSWVASQPATGPIDLSKTYWTYSTGNPALSVECRYGRDNSWALYLQVKYHSQGEELNYLIFLWETGGCFQGNKYYLRCPIQRGGRVCRNNVVRLYLPPGETIFGCTQCYKLTYVSRQQHDSRISMILKNPAQMVGIIKTGSLSALRLVTRVLEKFVDDKESRGNSHAQNR